MNARVIEVLAKSRVKFQEKIGKPITMSEAIKFETEKLTRLSKEDNFRY
tara:strand:- start:6451 stop:6597 length:147 start_codon:yes stop_codon:yes gene_type:complete